MLSHIRNNATSSTALGSVASLTLSRPGSLSSSRLAPAYSIGLLVIAKHPSGPSLFCRPTVLDQLYALLALSPRDFGMSRLPTSAVANFAARSRGLHVSVFPSFPLPPSIYLFMFNDFYYLNRLLLQIY